MDEPTMEDILRVLREDREKVWLLYVAALNREDSLRGEVERLRAKLEVLTSG